MLKMNRNTIIMASFITTLIIIMGVPMKHWGTSIQMCDSDLLEYVRFFCEEYNTTVKNGQPKFSIVPILYNTHNITIK